MLRPNICAKTVKLATLRTLLNDEASDDDSHINNRTNIFAHAISCAFDVSAFD